jgi:sugar-specific transcriptional regulator TrmB
MYNIVNALKAIGFAESEATVYLSLLQHGSSKAGSVAKTANLHRRTVYDALAKLSARGLVSQLKKNNNTYFEAVSPEYLKSMLKEKEALLEEIMPRLLTMKSPAQAEAKLFHGKHGLKAVFEDQIKEKKTILIYGASPLAYKIFRLYFKWYDARRRRDRIHVRAIFSSSSRDRIKNIPLAEVRFLPEKYTGPVAMNVYGNKVSMILWSAEPFALLIENKDVADGYRKFFELAWKRAKE